MNINFPKMLKRIIIAVTPSIKIFYNIFIKQKKKTRK